MVLLAAIPTFSSHSTNSSVEPVENNVMSGNIVHAYMAINYTTGVYIYFRTLACAKDFIDFTPGFVIEKVSIDESLIDFC